MGLKPLSQRLVLSRATARVALRRTRHLLTGVRAAPTPLSPPDPRVAIAPLSNESVTVAARAAGIPGALARRAVRDGALSAYSVRLPGRTASDLLCRTDLGTATVELLPVTGPRGDVDPGALAVLAAALLESDDALRRVSHAAAPSAGISTDLAAAGFVDEGWTPPPAGGVRPEDGGDWHLYTLLAPRDQRESPSG